MTPEEKRIIENGLRYSYNKLQELYFEMELLRIEHEGLTEIASKLGQYKNDNIKPHLEKAFTFDSLFWNWSDHSTRYYALGRGVHEIWSEKRKQAEEMFQNFKNYCEQLGFDVSDLSESFTGLNIAGDKWDDIITGFDGISKKSE